MTRITFKWIDPNTDNKDGYGTSQKPWSSVSIADPSEALENMIDPDEVVIPESSIMVLFNYPLKNETVLQLTTDGNFTRRKLIEAISNKYYQIYDDERNTTTLPIETISERLAREGKRCGLINRAETNGIWGIWGHVIEDLVLVYVKYDTQNGYWVMQIDS